MANLIWAGLNLSKANYSDACQTREFSIVEFLELLKEEKNQKEFRHTKIIIGDKMFGREVPMYKQLFMDISSVLTALVIRSELKKDDILSLDFPDVTFQSLKSIELHVYPSNNSVKADLQGILPLFENAKNITSISIVNSGKCGILYELICCLHALKMPSSLNNLQLQGPLGNRDFVQINEMKLHLSTLSLTFGMDLNSEALNEFLKTQSKTLRELKLGLFTPKLSELDVKIVIPKLDNLKSLIISERKPGLSLRLVSSLSETLPKLANLDLSLLWDREMIDKTFQSEVRADVVTSLTLDSLPDSGKFFQQIITSLPQLKTLKTIPKHYVIKTLLVNCRGLEELILMEAKSKEYSIMACVAGINHTKISNWFISSNSDKKIIEKKYQETCLGNNITVLKGLKALRLQRMNQKEPLTFVCKMVFLKMEKSLQTIQFCGLESLFEKMPIEVQTAMKEKFRIEF